MKRSHSGAAKCRILCTFLGDIPAVNGPHAHAAAPEAGASSYAADDRAADRRVLLDIQPDVLCSGAVTDLHIIKETLKPNT